MSWQPAHQDGAMTSTGIAVRVSDGSTSVYAARHGRHMATSTISADAAVRACAAKALGLVDAHRREGEQPGEYARRVSAAARRVKAYGMGSGIWTAYALPDTPLGRKAAEGGEG